MAFQVRISGTWTTPPAYAMPVWNDPRMAFSAVVIYPVPSGRDGNGYPISEPYINGAEIDQDRLFAVPEWTFDDEQGNPQRIRGPREFRHTLGAIINGLVSRGLMIVRFEEETSSALAPEPGSWEHFLQVVVPYMNLWAVKQKSLNQI